MLFRLRRAVLLPLAALLTLPPAAATGQAMAHPGWRGNGMAAEAWWKRTVFVRFVPNSSFQQIATSLDAVSAVGADSLILPDLLPAAGVASPGPSASPFAASFGTEDDLDALLREASARRMHVLLRAPLARLAANPGEVRFWLSRGVAGFDVDDATDPPFLQALRASMGQFPGTRLLLARVPASGVSQPVISGRGAVLVSVESAKDAETSSSAQTTSELRAVEVASSSGTSTSSGIPSRPASLAPLVPLLLTAGLPVLDSSLLANDAVREQVRSVLALRATNPVLRNVRATPAAASPVRAWWLRDGAPSRPPLLLLWNVASTDAPLLPVLQQAGVRSAYLVPLLRSDGHAGPLKISTDALPPDAVVLASTFGSVSAPRADTPRRHRRR